MSSPVNNISSAPPPRRHRSRGLFSVVLLLAWFAALGLVALNRHNITDWWKLQQYHPPDTIAALTVQDTMTPYARKLFYINQPQIDNKTVFSKNCPNNGGEQTIVLGCYRGGQSGIFLLEVDEPRLDGVTQVTAAHEMLHAAYERLSSAERKKVDGMLVDYNNSGLLDARVQKTVAAYKKSEPKDVINEMHSIFGTEVANLPAELEAYYKRYFDNRARVVSYAAQYQAEFTNRQIIVAQYDAQLRYLKRQIETGQDELQVKQGEIDSMQDRLLAQKNDGDTAGYNAGIPA
ncbi:MAG TPA: hypothetical protein VD706_01775, partial [Candidatus Saccharimonadales bacterium]|nr:hypothetical protein [Candidatus Saccharimonadales bacterium]